MEELFEVIFFENADGGCPAAEFLAGMEDSERVFMMHLLDDLELYGGRQNGTPARELENEIFDICLQKTDLHVAHILFFVHENQVVLTHGFYGEGLVTASEEVSVARRCREDFLCSLPEMQASARERMLHARFTMGPLWRPELDVILAEASKRSFEGARDLGLGSRDSMSK